MNNKYLESIKMGRNKKISFIIVNILILVLLPLCYSAVIEEQGSCTISSYTPFNEDDNFYESTNEDRLGSVMGGTNVGGLIDMLQVSIEDIRSQISTDDKFIQNIEQIDYLYFFNEATSLLQQTFQYFNVNDLNTNICNMFLRGSESPSSDIIHLLKSIDEYENLEVEFDLGFYNLIFHQGELRFENKEALEALGLMDLLKIPTAKRARIDELLASIDFKEEADANIAILSEVENEVKECIDSIFIPEELLQVYDNSITSIKGSSVYYLDDSGEEDSGRVEILNYHPGVNKEGKFELTVGILNPFTSANYDFQNSPRAHHSFRDSTWRLIPKLTITREETKLTFDPEFFSINTNGWLEPPRGSIEGIFTHGESDKNLVFSLSAIPFYIKEEGLASVVDRNGDYVEINFDNIEFIEGSDGPFVEIGKREDRYVFDYDVEIALALTSGDYKYLLAGRGHVPVN